MANVKAGTGSLKAVEAATPKHPAYKGSATINGRKFWLSGRKRTGDNGKPWLSLAVDQADEAAPSRPAPKATKKYDDGPLF
jgi:hypothetical protein